MSRLVSLSTEQLCTERAEGSGYQGWLTRSRNGSFRQGGTSCKKSYLAGENRFPFYGNVVVIIISDAWVRDASQFTDWESMEHEVTCSRPIYYLHHTYEWWVCLPQAPGHRADQPLSYPVDLTSPQSTSRISTSSSQLGLLASSLLAGGKGGSGSKLEEQQQNASAPRIMSEGELAAQANKSRQLERKGKRRIHY